MDNFERLFHKLYPKSASRRIKLRSHAQTYVEKLEKEKAINPDIFDKENELEKWRSIQILLDDPKVRIEQIDKIVFSDIFPNSLTM